MCYKLILLLSISVLPLIASCSNKAGYDVCIYGGTSSGVIAANACARQGLEVLLISPDKRLGGLTAGGLGYTDIGNKQVVAGLAKQFYRKVGKHYGKLEQWVFEPRVANKIFEEYASAPNIKIFRGFRLLSVEKEGARLRSVKVFSGEDTLDFKAKIFIDCSYEGDLMARSGVSYTVGREDNKLYGETFNGVQLLEGHQFPDGIDPFVIEGKKESGLLWGINNLAPGVRGEGDSLVQAYNFRICLTDSVENRIPITKPENYSPEKYELLLRLFKAQPEKRSLKDYFIISYMPNRKTDINNRGGFSTDMIGMNWRYPEASYSERDSIAKAHVDYTKGLLYFIGHDERVPEELRNEMLLWGYPKDEYVENGGWTPQLYVREARRMKGEYICTQADCEGRAKEKDGIAFAAYTMDSHNCKRVAVFKDGKYMVKNEGNVEVDAGPPYPIPYRSLTPLREECLNLLVPVCLSASHIAYGSIRMEPVFMVLGQVAAIAAKSALLKRCPVQDVDASEIVDIMKSDPYLDDSMPDIIIDDDEVSLPPGWERIRAYGGYGPSFLQRYGKGEPVEFKVPVSASGEYEIYAYQQIKWIDSLIKYEVHIGGETFIKEINPEHVSVDSQSFGEWVSLGRYEIKPGGKAFVRVTGECGSGRPVKADAVLLLPLD